MAEKGLRSWVKENWVDIANKKSDGSYQKCGRSKQKKDAKRKYPKCVPLAKARSMSEGQRRSAVSRKRAVAQGVGGKPTNVPTFAKRKKAATGGYFGPSISGEYGGVNLSNSSSKKYYGNLLKGFKIS